MFTILVECGVYLYLPYQPLKKIPNYSLQRLYVGLSQFLDNQTETVFKFDCIHLLLQKFKSLCEHPVGFRGGNARKRLDSLHRSQWGFVWTLGELRPWRELLRQLPAVDQLGGSRLSRRRRRREWNACAVESPAVPATLYWSSFLFSSSSSLFILLHSTRDVSEKYRSRQNKPILLPQRGQIHSLLVNTAHGSICIYWLLAP